MVVEDDVEALKRCIDPDRGFNVAVARRWIVGEMIMGQDDGMGSAAQRPFADFSWIHRHGVDRSSGHLLVLDHLTFGIEVDHFQDFLVGITKV